MEHQEEIAASEHDAFIASVGHDLRNPLNALTAAFSVLELYPPGTPHHDEARQVIARQLDRLRTIVEERLTPSR